MTEPNDESPAGRDPEEAGPIPPTQETPAETVAQRIIQAAYYYQGSMPPAQELEHYERVLPGLANRLMKLVEREAEHRQTNETNIVQAGIQLRSRGQWFGFVIAVLGLVGGVVLVALGASGWGLAVVLTGIAPIVGAFLYTYIGGRGAQRQNNLPEQQTNTEA